LNTGVTGIGIFLADLAAFTRDSRYLTASERAAEWLLATEGEDRLLGLHFGRAGRAAFMLRLYQVTGNRHYLGAAVDLITAVTPQDTALPDYTHGWAGIGLLRIAFALLTDEKSHLDVACAFGEALAATAEEMAPG